MFLIAHHTTDNTDTATVTAVTVANRTHDKIMTIVTSYYIVAFFSIAKSRLQR